MKCLDGEKGETAEEDDLYDAQLEAEHNPDDRTLSSDSDCRLKSDFLE